MEETKPEHTFSKTAIGGRRLPLSARNNSQAGYLRLLVEAMMAGESLQRPALAQKVGLSRLAVSELLATLETHGLVHVEGVIGGAPGRSQLSYALRPNSALAAGFDIGGTKVASAIADMRGNILAELTEPTDRTDLAGLIKQISRQIDRLCQAAGVPRYHLRTLAAGVPAAVHPIESSLSFADNLPGLEDGNFASALKTSLDLDVMIDNDVNLALLGEWARGGDQESGNIAFVALGTGIGGALMVDGRLLRGAHGGAGEVGYLPLWPAPLRGLPALEEQVGEAGIRRAYVAAGGSPQHSVRDIFAAANSGDQSALDTLDGTADHVARAIMTILALVDPDRIVLGGSVGARLELIERVKSRLAQAWPRTVRIECSQHGSRAGLLGAVELARDAMLKSLFGAHPARR